MTQELQYRYQLNAAMHTWINAIIILNNKNNGQKIEWKKKDWKFAWKWIECMPEVFFMLLLMNIRHPSAKWQLLLWNIHWYIEYVKSGRIFETKLFQYYLKFYRCIDTVNHGRFKTYLITVIVSNSTTITS